MTARDRGEPTFRVSQESAPSETVIAGFSGFGLAGLTAVDYLADHLELEPQGHVRAEGIPSITPFEEGRPRHPTQILSRDGLDATLLLSELFVPVWAADSFGEAVVDWTVANDVTDVTVLSGIPFAHGPDAHRTFYVATDDYREAHLDDVDAPPMQNGFLDGANAALMERGMETDLRVGVLVTPVHAQAPDVEAALRLLDTVSAIHDVPIDTDPLREFATQVQQYYANLSERIDRAPDGERPEDRMYM
ncbi:PAC2 family protein [Halostella sp. PRR32]|uniref:proteasome assembly chaperone family protein n=1 Tax=Halostella sp. PRR32 TaxID=3098147 RepID=UPI002B1DD299|nr:PAC2 family protein [Halostella sp. PRR32]